METENTNLQSNPVQTPFQNELNQEVINNHRRNYLLIFGAIFLIVIVGIIGYIYYRNTAHYNSTLEKNPVSQGENNSNNISQQNIQKDELPKLAYIETTGIALPEDKNPDLGGVFMVNPDGSDKKLLYKFDRTTLVNAYGFPMYSSLTHEILKYSSDGAIAINIDTGVARNLYKQKQNTSFDFVLSGDNKSIYITESATDTQRMATGKTYRFIVSLQGSNMPKEIDSFPVDKQPYFDSRTGKSVEVNIKDSTVGGAGTHINSSEIIVTDIKSNTKKSFVYNKPGEIEPLFIANNYFYFKVNQCCASTSRLPSMTQLNLDTGEFSSPSSIPEITQKLANTNLTLENKGISPDGMYYVYSVVNNLVPNNGDIKTYLYNTNTKQETALNVGIDSFVNWSSDSKFILFNYDEPGSYIYSIDSKKVEQTKIPSSTNYIILR